MRIVGTLTTLPSRINHIAPTLKSIYNQTLKLDAVYLGIPSVCKRTREKYPEVPKSYKKYCQVVPVEDYGPITKIVPALMMEEDCLIVSFDDDIVYHPTLVEKFYSYYKKNKNCAIGTSGFCVGTFPFYLSGERGELTDTYFKAHMGLTKDGKDVDILAGYAGAMYERSFFPTKENMNNLLKHTQHPDIFRNDDVLISSWLCKENIPRRIFPTVSFEGKFYEDRLSVCMYSFIGSCIQAIQECEQRGLLTKRVGVNPFFTLGGVVIILFLILCCSTIYILHR